MVETCDGRILNSYDAIANFKILFANTTLSGRRGVLSSDLIQVVGVKTVYDNKV